MNIRKLVQRRLKAELLLKNISTDKCTQGSRRFRFFCQELFQQFYANRGVARSKIVGWTSNAEGVRVEAPYRRRGCGRGTETR